MNTKTSPTFRLSDQFETSKPRPQEEIADSPIEDTAHSNDASTPAESEPAEPIGVICQPKGRGTETSVKEPSIQPNSPPIEIDFRQLEDGRCVELIEDPADPTKTKLAVFDGDEVHVVSKFEYRGQIFVPVARKAEGLGDIVLPCGSNPYRSIEEILERIIQFLDGCVFLGAPYLNILAAFVLYDWFADKLQPPVYLLITGLPQSGKTTLLEVMRLLCRRSLLVGDITAAAVLNACSRFMPTLLIDENDWQGDQNSRMLRKTLRTGTSGNLLARHLRTTQKAFGAKILSALELPEDLALRSRCVHVPMAETDRVDLQKPWSPETLMAADALRCSLLHLRLEKYSSISWRLVPGAEQLRPRSRDLLGSLVAALPIGSAAEKSLFEFFRDVHNPSTRNLLSPAQDAVVAALFKFVHMYPEAGCVQVGKIAELVNESLKASGERFGLTPRKLTGLLASLGFGDIMRSGRGSQRVLDQEAVRKIHILARDHDIMVVGQQGLREQVQACKLCRGDSSIMFRLKKKTSADTTPAQGDRNPQP